jgi:hypothetical protein
MAGELIILEGWPHNNVVLHARPNLDGCQYLTYMHTYIRTHIHTYCSDDPVPVMILDIGKQCDMVGEEKQIIGFAWPK